jgi:hypothetical protein
MPIFLKKVSLLFFHFISFLSQVLKWVFNNNKRYFWTDLHGSIVCNRPNRIKP